MRPHLPNGERGRVEWNAGAREASRVKESAFVAAGIVMLSRFGSPLSAEAIDERKSFTADVENHIPVARVQRSARMPIYEKLGMEISIATLPQSGSR